MVEYNLLHLCRKYSAKEDLRESGCTNCSDCSRGLHRFVTGLTFSCIVVLIISNVYLHYRLATITYELCEKYPSVSSNDHEPAKDDLPTQLQHHRNLQKRQEFQGRQRRGNRRRHRRERTAALNQLRQELRNWITRSPMQLRGQNGTAEFWGTYQTSSATLNTDCRRNGCFRWATCALGVHHCGGYDFLTESNATVGIKIREGGFYRISAQVVVYGNRSRRSADPAVGFKIVVLKGGLNIKETLEETFVTQGERGYNPGLDVYPFDTISISGDFELNCNDIVYVGPVTGSVTATFKMHETQTHFGLFMISRAYNAEQNNFSCSEVGT